MSTPQQAHDSTLAAPAALAILHRRWLAFAVTCSLFLIGGYAALRLAWQPGDAPAAENTVRWLALASATLVYLLAILWRGLPHNRRAGESRLLPTLGWGNRMTLLRGMLVAGLVGFLFSPRPEGWMAWIPGLLYTLADAADFLDGYLARLTNHATRLGEILDMSLDGLGVLAVATLAVQYGQAPLWYLSVGLARYLFLAGLWLRKRLGKPVYEAPPSIARRGFAGLQMGFIAVILWPLFSPPATHIAAALFALPFLAGFLRDWLFVSGVLRPGSKLPGGLQSALTRWLPVFLRLGIAALVLSTWVSSSLAAKDATALIVFEAVIVALLVLGVASRVMAIAALILLGVHQMLAPLTPTQVLLAIAYTTILFMGSGAFSLWKPEDRLIYHRAGERRAVQAEGG
jgi:CDP-diacylglycerol--glycerol-3-phosphate 3-phosphatidyltransferase